MLQSNSHDGGSARKASRLGESRTPMHLVFQASIGVILGLGLASVIDLPAAQLALTGVVISIVAWVIEHGVDFSSRNLRTAGRIGLLLKLVALIGFTISVSSLVGLVSA